MITPTRALLLTVAFAFGALARLQIEPKGVEQTSGPLKIESPDATPVAPPPAPHTRSVASPALQEVQDLQRQLDGLTLRIADLEDRIEARIGSPVEPPDDLDHAYTEEGAEQALQSLLDQMGSGTIEHLDCGEFPCVAVLMFEMPVDGTQEELHAFQRRFEATRREGPYGEASFAMPSTSAGPPPDHPTLLNYTMTLQPEGMERMTRRNHFRYKEAQRRHFEELSRWWEATP